MNTVLFLCTGNYYRSRFAEYLFNARACQQNLNWTATSRALALERGKLNVGAISHYARAGLAERGILLPEIVRLPQAALDLDFAAATRVIALDECEHRPLIEDRFARWRDRVEYWSVPDVNLLTAEIALARIEEQTEQLLERELASM